MKHAHEPDYKRVALALFLTASLLIGWQSLVEAPRRQQYAQNTAVLAQQKEVVREKQVAEIAAREADTEYNPRLTRADRLAASKRVDIRSHKLHGSLALKGARLDDLTLSNYKVALEQDSPDVTLFSPNGDTAAYFAQAGWISGDTKVPDQQSLWKADNTNLAPGTPVTLRWDNGAGVTFVMTLALDDDYMFTIGQRVENRSGHEIVVAPYGYINRAYNDAGQHNAISHEGPLGVVDGRLTEISYKDLREKEAQPFDKASGWLGITDKYWLAALVPGDTDFKANFSHYSKNSQERYQVDYLGAAHTVKPGGVQEGSLRLFAGAKEIVALDRYAAGSDAQQLPPVPLFDRAVDFGSLYFLTKPMFLTLNFFYTHIGNFGLAIMLLTILVKLCMFPLANKSYKSMSQMRLLQPEMTKLRERFADDNMALQKEMMALYKREKVNPASGCLPILLQMPVFFALYKVLFVSIEMRHAPFFGWLRDLSAPDPSNLFTAFGLLPWHTPSFLHLGLLPVMMCATMLIQQRQQPMPTDPVQAKMMKIMPYAFLFFFATFPAGLVLYWVWSNTLSILQQEVISRRYNKASGKKTAAA